MIAALMNTSESVDGWSDIRPVLVGAAAALVGSLLATLLSQKHQRDLAEAARVEARRIPARALVLNISRTVEEWGAAAILLDDSLHVRSEKSFHQSLEEREAYRKPIDREKTIKSLALSDLLYEATLMFSEKPLLDAVKAIDAHQRAVNKLLDDWPPDEGAWLTRDQSEVIAGVNQADVAAATLRTAATPLLRTPLS